MSDGKHPVPCEACGTNTYRKAGICWSCDGEREAKLPLPGDLPDAYLIRCAQELLRRHNERHALLTQLGVKAEAA